MPEPANKITLLVPCYNAGKFLPRLMESVRAMPLRFAEMISYDDGSVDDTAEVARRLELKVISGNSNRGVAHARNQLVAAVQTEWFHFHDADDLLGPAFLTRLAPWCNEHHDVVTCDADWLDAHSRTCLIPWRYDAGALNREAWPALIRRPMSLNNSIIRREAWNKIGGCDESLCMWEDADVHIRLAQSGARFYHVPEVLSFALRRQDSFSHDYLKSWTCRLNSLERYAADKYPEAVRNALAAEAETAAGELAYLNAKSSSLRAIDLCRRLGGGPPSSSSLAVRLLKVFLPAYSLLRWQANRRKRGLASA